MTASLTLATTMLPSAPVGPPNPLPAVAAMPQAPYEASTDGLPDEIAANIRYGRVTSIHPYLLQDAYSRERTDAPMRLAVLENEHLRAEFALELGGRLVRLLDKTTGRDLVYRNEMFSRRTSACEARGSRAGRSGTSACAGTGPSPVSRCTPPS